MSPDADRDDTIPSPAGEPIQAGRARLAIALHLAAVVATIERLQGEIAAFHATGDAIARQLDATTKT